MKRQPSIHEKRNDQPEDEIRSQLELWTDDLPDGIERHGKDESEVAMTIVRITGGKSKCQLIQ